MTTTLLPKQQFRYRINLAKSYRRLEQKIEQHNLLHQNLASNQIRAAQRCLAEKIIRLYKRRFEHWQAECLGLIEGLQLPTLLLNNQLLSRMMSVTDRTIKNYRARLHQLGLITSSLFYGSKKPFEITLNADFLVFEKKNKSGQWQVDQQIFPLTSTCTSSGTFTSTSTGTPLEENSTNDMENQQVPTDLSSQVRPQEPMDRNEQGSIKNQEKIQVAERFAQELWAVAKPILWKDQYFSVNEEVATKAALLELFLRGPVTRFVRYFEIALYRIHLTRIYWRKEFGRPVPAPHQFFDLENQEGFVRTRAWLFEPEKYPIQRVSYRHKRRLQTQSNARNNSMQSIANLFK